MNDDLHKTAEPAPIPDAGAKQAADSWQMPEPVFRRSSGRAGVRRVSEAPQAPSTIVPDRLKKRPAGDKMPDVQAQPLLADDLERDEMDFSDLRANASEMSKLPGWIVVVAIVALVGIASAIAVAIVFGYIVWR